MSYLWWKLHTFKNSWLVLQMFTAIHNSIEPHVTLVHVITLIFKLWKHEIFLELEEYISVGGIDDFKEHRSQWWMEIE